MQTFASCDRASMQQLCNRWHAAACCMGAASGQRSKSKEEGVSNCNVYDAPSFSFCEVWKFFKPPCFESFPQIFDFSHIKLEQYP